MTDINTTNNIDTPQTADIKTDPRWTAFLLQELDPQEQEQLQKILDSNPELQSELNSLKKTIETVSEVLKNESLPKDPNNVSMEDLQKPSLTSDANAIIQLQNRSHTKRFAAGWYIRCTILLLVVIFCFGVGYYFNPGRKMPYHEVALNTPSMDKINNYDKSIIKKEETVDTSQATDKDSFSLPKISIKTDSDQEMTNEKELSPMMQTNKSRSSTQVYNGKLGVPPVLLAPSAAPDQSGIPNNSIPREAEISRKSNLDNTVTDNNMDNKKTIGGKMAAKQMGGQNRDKEILTTEQSPNNNNNISNSNINDNSSNLQESKVKYERERIAGMNSHTQRQKMAKQEMTKSNVISDSEEERQPYVRNRIKTSDEEYREIKEKPFIVPNDEPFSTFSIDVDTASYSNVRRLIENNQPISPDAVRIEEMVNYFHYDYKGPKNDSKDPFATNIMVESCPWATDHLLVRIGLKGKEIAKDKRPPLHLVFLIDVSGSMSSSNKLPLVKKALAELVEELNDNDQIAIVVYAGSSRIHLESTAGSNTAKILDSIQQLSAGGSTAGAEGIQTAYRIAREQYHKDAVNRIILCTDGDFNVGVTDNKMLEEMIFKEAKSGVFLSILGFGMGNYKDNRLATLSNKGNGNYGYIDNLQEARKLLVNNMTGTLVTIAKDVKIQVDFNPNRVAAYRLIGYDDRLLAARDFNDDKKDAGEIGAGHTITALYEIVPIGVEIPNINKVDQSRYNATKEESKKEDAKKQESKEKIQDKFDKELMFVKLRYKLPKENKSILLTTPVVYEKNKDKHLPEFDFQAAVALFGMLLRESPYAGNATYDTVLELAKPGLASKQDRTDFIKLVEKVKGQTDEK